MFPSGSSIPRRVDLGCANGCRARLAGRNASSAGHDGQDLEHRERDDQRRGKDRQAEPDEAKGAPLVDPLAAPDSGASGCPCAQLRATLEAVGRLLIQGHVVLGMRRGHREVTVLAWSDGSRDSTRGFLQTATNAPQR